LGTSGSGKTSFLKALYGDFFIVNDVKRKHTAESKAELTYTPINPEEDSTTTISINQLGTLVLFTKNNQMELFEIRDGVDEVLNRDDVDYFMTFSIFDSPGQSRFSFMIDVCLKGADGIILMADGTNVSSIEYLSQYIEQIKAEEYRKKKKIPVVIFVNKSDLSETGQYLGADFVRTAVQNEYDVFETTIKDVESFNLPLRKLISIIREQGT
jgi:small GTP-binding protein